MKELYKLLQKLVFVYHIHAWCQTPMVAIQLGQFVYRYQVIAEQLMHGQLSSGNATWFTYNLVCSTA